MDEISVIELHLKDWLGHIVLLGEPVMIASQSLTSFLNYKKKICIYIPLIINVISYSKIKSL